MTYSENRSAASALRSKAPHLVLALLGAAGLCAATAVAQAGDPPPANQGQAQAVSSKPAKPNPQDREICREEKVTGSILSGKRVCHTKREWDQMEQDAKDWLDATGRVSNMTHPH
jgi:hypothetical protein